MRIEQLKAEREVMQGQGNARNLAPGYLFKLLKYPRSDQNQQYLIEAADYRFEENVYVNGHAVVRTDDQMHMNTKKP